MRRLLAFCVAVLLGASVPAAAQTTTPRADQLVEISGRVSPELIPDYLVWEQVFRLLTKTTTSSELLSDAAYLFTSADRVRVMVEAEASVARSAACEVDLLDQFDVLRAAGASPDAIIKATRDLTLECRLATLAGVDLLLGSLSEAARFSLSAFAVEHRSEMTVVLLARDLAFFRQPR
jgi:hypothetical protein